MDENDRIYYEVNKGYLRVGLYFVIAFIIIIFLRGLDVLL